MNWWRYLRAIEAKYIERIEEKRDMQRTGKLKSEDLTRSDWEAIQAHDELLAEYGSDIL